MVHLQTQNVFKVKDRFAVIKNQKTKKTNSFFKNKEWLEKCPATIRTESIFEAKANLQACFSNLKAKNIERFNLPFRTKKHEKLRGWSISIDKRQIKKQGDKLTIFQRTLGEMKYHGVKQLHKLISNAIPEMDCKIQRNSYGEYFLIIPYKVNKKPVKSTFTNPVSVDPGVRKFLTTFAPNTKESFMMGNRWSTEMMKHLLILDRETDKDKVKRLRKRVYNLKKEMRNQCASFLSKRYDLILIPRLDVSKLVIKANRRLRTKTVRQMLCAGHCEFFDFLKEKCWEHGSKFLHVREEYTSQTCPNCGCLNKCNELYKCKKCDYTFDRDLTGALNIMLKAVRNPDI
jgi:transposase